MSKLIQEMPNEERPREKLKTLGPSSLSNAELLALFIRTGMKGRNAIQVGQDLIDQHGGLAKLGRLEVNQIASTLGIGPAKASQIIAAFELGARVAKEQMITVPLNSPEKIYAVMQPQIAHLRHEVVYVLTTDSRIRLLSCQEISRGSVNQAIANIRDLLRPAILQQAHGMILIHNHPSGNPSPSDADHQITNKLREAADLFGIKLHDHLIIGQECDEHDSYFSFREHRQM